MDLASIPGGDVRVYFLTVLGEVKTKANINLSPALRRASKKGLNNPAAIKKKERMEAAKNWELAVAQTLKHKHGRLKLEGPVGARICYFLSSGSRPHKVRRDLDNLTKSMLDGLEQGGAFAKGDHQVVVLILEKEVDEERPRVEVSIWSEK